MFYHKVYFTIVYLCSVTFGYFLSLLYNAVAVNNCTKVSSSTRKSVHRVDFQNCDCWVKALCEHSVDVCHCLPAVFVRVLQRSRWM